MTTPIKILLPTYNGEKYLAMQIDSILSQSYTSWELYMKDDGSTDRTLDIIKHYSELHSNIHFIQNFDHLGACGSFLWLLKHTAGTYYMFCDQDDIWFPDKIELSIAKMHRLEHKHGTDKPILIHSDMTVVDEDLQAVASSFWRFIKVDPACNSFYDLAACNNVNGCTILLNEAAKQVALENCEHAIMHDVWVALRVACCKGVIAHIDRATVLYRQHANNVLGARPIDSIGRKIVSLTTIVKKNREYFQMLNHAGQISLCTYLVYKLKMLVVRRRIK